MINPETVTQMAVEYGFDLVGFAPAGPTPGAQAFLDWLSAGYAGEMQYLAREPSKRLDPRQVLPDVLTVVIVGMSYDTQAVAEAVLRDPSRGRIARYAWGGDYHDVITPRLRAFGERLAKSSRAYVDTGPVLERAWAEQCGLGFIGNNTCLIHRKRGSYFFLGAVLVSEEMGEIGDWRLGIPSPEAGSQRSEIRGQKSEIGSQRSEVGGQKDEDAAAQSHISNPQSLISNPKSQSGCGRCTRCLTACPTQAFAAAGVLDARRCISYLTIEQKGSIPVELRPLMGNWIFGCDVCQDVCPYVRRYSTPAREKLFYPADVERAAPRLLDVLALDRNGFNVRYKGTPLLRAKRRGLVRNACVAVGNWGSRDALPALESLLSDDEPLVREHVAWAIERIKENE